MTTKNNLYTGTIDKNSGPQAKIHLLRNSKKESYFLSTYTGSSFFHGDEVEVSLTEYTNVSLVRILKPIGTSCGSITQNRNGDYYFQTGNNSAKIKVPADMEISAGKDKMFVVNLKLSADQCHHELETAEVIASPSNIAQSRMAAMHKHGFNIKHSEDASNEAFTRAGDVQFPTVDYSMLPLVSIDGPGARDLDDVAYSKELDDGSWHVFVAIADVSRYVRHGSKLDLEAYDNATSIYTPGEVFPMLPSILSNEVCSLNPNAMRYTLMLEILLDPKGNTQKYQFFEAKIRSHMRYTYERAQELIDGALPNSTEEETLPVLQSMDKLKDVLIKKRTYKTAVEFQREEHGVKIFNDNVEGFFIRPSFGTNRLIEEIMVLANNCAAQYLIKHYGYGLFRHHQGLKEEAIPALNYFLCSYDVDINLTTKSSSNNCADARFQLPDEVKEEFDTLFKKSLHHAVYSATESDHFGLGLLEYGHFTSPIRRYPDLVVHRMIKYILQENLGQSVTGAHLYSCEELKEIAEHCTERSFEASLVEREVMDTLSVLWWESAENKDVTGTVVNKAKGMVFFRLEGTPSNAACPESLLNDDIEIGDKVNLTISQTDINKGRIGVVPKEMETPF